MRISGMSRAQGIHFSLDFLYTEDFSRHIRLFSDTGLFQIWNSRHLRLIHKENEDRRRGSDSVANDNGNSKETVKLASLYRKQSDKYSQLGHLLCVFIVGGLGLGSALISYLIEILFWGISTEFARGKSDRREFKLPFK
jgi:hypothetical protein